MRQCFGQPCQKQPSTKTAILCRGKQKSGVPRTGYCRRQPEMPFSRKAARTKDSVDLFPFDLTFAMIFERSDVETVSIPYYEITSIHDSSNFKASSTSSRSRRGGFLIRIASLCSGTFSIIVNCDPCGCHVNTWQSPSLS